MTFSQLPGDAAASPAASPKIRYAPDGCAHNIPLDVVSSQPALACTHPSWASDRLRPPFHHTGMRTLGLRAGVSGRLAQSFHPPGSETKDLLVRPKAKHGGFVGQPRAIIRGPKAAFACAYAVQCLLGDRKDL